MNIHEARLGVERQAHQFEALRRRLIHTAIEAHLDHGVSANAVAATLAGAVDGPGWGRDRVLALLAAARTARTANGALQAAKLGRIAAAAHTEPGDDDGHDIAAPATTAYLHMLTGARLGRGGATVALNALNRVGLTIDTDNPETVLETATQTTPPLHLTPLPRP